MAVVGLVLLVGAFFVFAFGATRLLLRGTALEPYTVEASVFAGPLLTVLALSAFAYRPDDPVGFRKVLFLFLAGAALSAAVCAGEWRRLAELLRDNAGRLLVILPPACFAAGILTTYFPGNEWQTYSVYSHNHEYLNYAELAACRTGQYKVGPEAPPDPFIAYHRTIRYGQDLLTAAVARLSRRHPLNAVLPLTVFLRFQQSIALGLLLFTVAPTTQRYWLVPALLVFDGYHLGQLFTFSGSFLSSNCTLPLCVAYLLALSAVEGFDGRVVFALALVNLYGLITYPELLAVVKCFELALVAAFALRRQGGRCATAIAVNLAVLLTHPALVLDKVGFVVRASSFVTGYNAFGHPLREPLDYLANLFGLTASWASGCVHASRPLLVNAAAAVAAVLVPLGLVTLARRHRAWPLVLTWSAFVLFFHARPVEPGSLYYGALKFLTQTHALMFAGLASLFALPPRSLRCGLGLGLALWATAAGLATARLLPAVKCCAGVYEYAPLQRALLREAGPADRVACLTGYPQALKVLELAARECGVPLKPLSVEQADWLRYNRAATAPTGVLLFEGIVLTDARMMAGGTLDFASGPLRFEKTRTCAQLGALTLCRGRVFSGPPPARCCGEPGAFSPETGAGLRKRPVSSGLW